MIIIIQVDKKCYAIASPRQSPSAILMPNILTSFSTWLASSHQIIQKGEMKLG